MEFFGARADLPIETCLAEVRRSDVLVIIVGHRYGTLAPGLGISFSEAEYREGHRLGKPCLVYLRHENAPVLPKHFERDPDKLRLLDKWKEHLTNRHTVATYRDPQDLALQVAADLGRTIHAIEESAREEAPLPSDRNGPTIAEVQGLLTRATEKGIPAHVLVSAIRRTVSELLVSMGDRKPVVFMCYSHADAELVRETANVLTANDIQIWLDEAEVAPGDFLLERIQHGLDSADFLALFLSRAALGSRWAALELNAMISRQVRGDRGAVIIPVLLDDSEVPPLLRDVVYVDMRSGEVALGAAKLVSAIRRHHVERLHTFEAPTNRYFNPAERVAELGRALEPGSFVDLISQLGKSEVLFGLYRNQVGALVATHLHSITRQKEMEDLWAPAEGYFAFEIAVANQGLTEKIPTIVTETGV